MEEFNEMMEKFKTHMNQMRKNNHYNKNFMMDDKLIKLQTKIDSCEKKILELEENIKQKDNEIFSLKEKLNNYEKITNNLNIQTSMENQMNMNNNQTWIKQYNITNNNNSNFELIDSNIQNMINIKKEDNGIELIFRYENKTYKEFCTYNEKLKKVMKRFCKKNGIKFREHKFMYCGKNLINNITVAESGLMYNSIINVIYSGYSKQNDEYEDTDSDDGTILISFHTTTGKINLIKINQENSVGTAIKKYLIKIGKLDLINRTDGKIVFIYNAQLLKNDDKTKLKVFFGSEKNPRIMVNELNNLIGG